MTKTALLFSNGGSQAVRLSAEFCFDGDQVYLRRDSLTGEVILSRWQRSSWREFMTLRAWLLPLTEDLPAKRGLSIDARDPFEDWRE